MDDQEIIQKLKSICFFKHEFKKDKCVKIEFTDKSNCFFGTIRHNNNKKEILKLINELKNLEYLDLRKNRIVESFFF